LTVYEKSYSLFYHLCKELSLKAASNQLSEGDFHEGEVMINKNCCKNIGNVGLPIFRGYN